MARVEEWNRTLAFDRELTIQPFGLIRPYLTSFQGIEITDPSVKIDCGECGLTHEPQSLFVAIEDRASAVRGQQSRGSADERFRCLFIRRDSQSSTLVGHERLSPDRIDPRGSPAFILGSKNELIGRWRFYANNKIGALGINDHLSVQESGLGSIASFGGLPSNNEERQKQRPCSYS